MHADRHIQLLTMKDARNVLVSRSIMLKTIRSFLGNLSLSEVHTPILGAVASGATARPFETFATEFPDRRLTLRIAPELWLKRLILGDFSGVYEIGPAFRNEGKNSECASVTYRAFSFLLVFVVEGTKPDQIYHV